MGGGISGQKGGYGNRPVSFPPYPVIPPAMPIANMPLTQPGGLQMMTTPTMLPMPPTLPGMSMGMNPMMGTPMVGAPMMGGQMMGPPMMGGQMMGGPGVGMGMQGMPMMNTTPLPVQQAQIMPMMPPPMQMPPPPPLIYQMPQQQQQQLQQQPQQIFIQPPPPPQVVQPYPLDQLMQNSYQNIQQQQPPIQSFYSQQEQVFPQMMPSSQPTLKVTNLPPTYLRNQPYRQIPVETYSGYPQMRTTNIRNQTF